MIFEKDKLGGQFNLAALPPHKSSLARLVNYYETEIKRLNISIRFEKATATDLLNGGFDGVILATGSEPAIPPIKGLKDYFWAEVLEEKNMVNNKNILIIGGGLIGLEVATALIEHGNKVTIVEMMEEVGRGMEIIERTLILKTLKSHNVKIHVNAKVEEVYGNKAIIGGEKSFEIDGIDHIVLATGMRSNNPLLSELDGKISLYVVGDAKKVGNAQDAIRDAYSTVKSL